MDWHERQKMLKFSFPVNIESPKSTYEIPYGHIVRDTDGDENPGQRWIDVSGFQNGNAYGLTVINDAKHGYNVIGNDMRISIARSAVFAHHRPRKIEPDGIYQWMDQGIHTFRMVVIPHNGTWLESKIAQQAEELMAPPVAIYQGIHGGKLPKSGSFLSVDNPSVIVSSIKQAEDNSDIIIRCVEISGHTTSSTIDLRFAGKKWNGSFRAFEIKTLRMNSMSGEIIETNLLEEV
ncbi:glycoside hydrolase family 38 C-terminal domain-containing protein [Maribellus maritimus]|uniref:glycoside hydrolase family 38 C-terminal domain-containing protein n=1 Tax=Maribellus maritimus TaxID=2870838 RepID=UPI0021D40592|nr:glycoside hydrolase family 38 C-terminal domain-containing protein [Maribellus maritimus]